MGNSGGKDKISKEDMQFLQEKTQLDKDSIQVCFPSPVILSWFSASLNSKANQQISNRTKKSPQDHSVNTSNRSYEGYFGQGRGIKNILL